jgi:transposase
VENVEAVFEAGAFPYLAFQANATGGAGGLWQKVFCFLQRFRAEFLEHYHQRSNAASTFALIKAKFGGPVRSRIDTAMTNEVLCKVLCHNLCCRVQAQHELGREPTCWEEEDPPVERPAPSDF